MLWLYSETLTVEFANTPLSQFTVSYQPNRRHFRRVSHPHVFETQYRSPQLLLWGGEALEWHLVQRLPEYGPRRNARLRPLTPAQLALFPAMAEA
jgi:hypothetical protein